MRWHRLGLKGDLGGLYTRSKRIGLRKYELSPEGLYWGSSGADRFLFQSAVEIVGGLTRKWNCQSISWNFRYDSQEELEFATKYLALSNCSITQSYTHVLNLRNTDFDTLVKQRIKSVTRQQVRQGINSGLEVREIKSQNDLDQHESLYLSWSNEKGINPKPLTLFKKLAIEFGNSVSLLGAFNGEYLVAALLVFRESKEWFYWHSIRDSAVDHKFAMDVLLWEVLREAFAANISYFNMGGSNGIKSLEFFKERWGGEKRVVWNLKWTNPVWTKLLNYRQAIQLDSKVY